MYPWKSALNAPILANSAVQFSHGLRCAECCNILTVENSQCNSNKDISQNFLRKHRSHAISYVGTPFPCVPAPLHHCFNMHRTRL